VYGVIEEALEKLDNTVLMRERGGGLLGGTVKGFLKKIANNLGRHRRCLSAA
jgi:hypothetical protein